MYKKYWMNKLFISLLFLTISLIAANAITFEAYTENPSGIKVFDSNGFLADQDTALEQFSEGWIIQTRNSELELTLEMGAVKMGPQSLLSVDSFNDYYVDLYLLRGQVRVISDAPQMRISLATSTASYSFSQADVVLVSEEEELFYTRDGSVDVVNRISGEEFRASSLDKVSVGGRTTTITPSPSQVASAAASLPISHYSSEVQVAQAEEKIEPPPIPEPTRTEPAVEEPEIEEKEEEQPVPEPEPEPEPTPEPEEEEVPVIKAQEPEPEPQPEPEVQQIEPEVEIVEQSPEPIIEEEPQVPQIIELEVTREEEEEEIVSTPESRNIRLGMELTTGIMHNMLPQSGGSPYIITRISPSLMIGNAEIGLRLHAAFNGNPLDLSNWFAQRGDLLWNFGGGRSGDELISDIITDSLSLIDYVTYGDQQSSFFVRINDASPIAFGLGTRLGNLQTAIDHPYIRRAGLYNRFDGTYAGYELFIDDITYARLFGLRLTASPIPNVYPFTVGFYGIADIQTRPDAKILLVPGVDLQLPIMPGFMLVGDFSALMHKNYNNESSFVYDASYADGLENFQATGGVQGDLGSFKIKLLANFRRGELPFNPFGDDYHWRRNTMLSELSTITGTGDHIDLYSEIEMVSDSMNSYFSYMIPLSVPAYAFQFEEDRFRAGFSFDTEAFALGLNAGRRDLTGLLNDPSTFLSKDTTLSVFARYTTGKLSTTLSYSQAMTNEADTKPDPLLTIETSLQLASLRRADSETVTTDHLLKPREQGITEDQSISEMDSDSIFSLDVGLGAVASLDDARYDGPYTLSGIYPRFSFGSVSFGLQLDGMTNGNPLETRFKENVNDKWDAFSLVGNTDFFNIKDMAIGFLSFIDYVKIGSPERPFYLNIDDSSSITLGLGTMIRDLNTSIDDPFIDRSGLYSRLSTKSFTHEVVLNDLSDPRLAATRFALRPSAEQYPFELGLSAVMDLSFEAPVDPGDTATRMLIVPGLDMSFPLAYTEESSVSIFADANLLMVYDRGTFKTDSFFDFSNTDWFDKFYNYNASAGLRWESENLTASAFFTYQKGFLESNMFGLDYPWRWEDQIKPLLTDYRKDAGHLETKFNLTAVLSYEKDDFGIDALYSMRRNDTFGFDSGGVTEARNAPDIIGVDMYYQMNDITGSFGMTKRGITTYLPPTERLPFFEGGSVQAYAKGTYEGEHASFTAGISIAGDYTASPQQWTPALWLHTRIGLL
jgi:hypothetical protein